MNTANIMEELDAGKIYQAESLQVTGKYQNGSGISQTNGANTELETTEEDNGVTLELSEEGKQKLAELQNLKTWANQMREDNKKAEKHTDDTAKIMTIFRRIANGDIVPPRDEKKLMEHSMEMYQAAKNIASMKENEEPKKYKSVDEDEEDDNGAISQEEAIRALSDSQSSGSIDISASLEGK
ncbi:MAG: hypothetical protein IJ419_06670 [Agathobacter sp.]|nr:hypothetical protein [Agathobacter sp.]